MNRLDHLDATSGEMDQEADEETIEGLGCQKTLESGWPSAPLERDLLTQKPIHQKSRLRH